MAPQSQLQSPRFDLDIQTVLADPDFIGLPLKERLKLIQEIDPEFISLPGRERLKLLREWNIEPDVLGLQVLAPIELPTVPSRDEDQPSPAFQAKFGIPAEPPDPEIQAAGRRALEFLHSPLLKGEEATRVAFEYYRDNPLLPIIDVDEPTRAGLLKFSEGVLTDVGGKVVEPLTSPLNLGLIASGAAAPAAISRLLAGGFSLIMATEAVQAIQDGRFQDAAIMGAFSMLAGAGAKHRKGISLLERWKEHFEKTERMSPTDAARAAEISAGKGLGPPDRISPEQIIKMEEAAAVAQRQAEATGKVKLGPAVVPEVPVRPTPSETVGPELTNLELLGAMESGGIIKLRFGPASKVTVSDIQEVFKGLDVEVAKMRGIHETLGARPTLVQNFDVTVFDAGGRISGKLARQALNERLGGIQRFTMEPVRQRLSQEVAEKAVARAAQKAEAKQERARAQSQQGILRLQGELPEGITITPRPQDLRPMLEFFESPSRQFGRIHPAAGKVVELTIEATEKIAHKTKIAIRDQHDTWRPLSRSQVDQAITLLNDPTVTPQNLPTTMSPKVRNAYLRTRAQLDNMRERINEARHRAGEPEIEGITSGYWPHVFRGDWAVLRRVVEGDKERWTPIDTGWLQDSQVAAVAKAREYFAENPGSEIRVELKRLHMQPDEATVLPRGSYFRLMNRLSKASALEIDPLTGEMMIAPMGRTKAADQLRGVARPGGRRPTRARFGHVERRQADLAGWVEDPKALGILIRGAERYIEMLPLRKEVAKLMEQVKREVPGAERLSDQLESYIGAAIEGRPDKLTRSFNAAWQHIGEAMGLPARPGALQRISRRAVEIQSILKLGFSPVSALVNLSQTPLNTFPVLGTQWTMVGMRRYVEAGRSQLSRKPNADWKIIEELGILEQATKAEELTVRDYVHRLPRTAREAGSEALGLVREFGLYLFRQAEQANRSVAGLGAYHRSRAAGLSHQAAIAEARNVVTRTQFQYGPTDSPAVLRQAWTRVPGQFKTFFIKEMEFILGLNRREFARFATALVTTTGALGAPGAELLDESTRIVTGFFGEEFSPLDWIGVRARKMGPLARIPLTGVSGALGFDLLRNIGFRDMFSPRMFSVRDLVGPTFNDVGNFMAWLQAPEGREAQQAKRRFLTSLSPAVRRFSSLLDESVLQPDAEGRRKLVDPRTGQTILDDVTEAEAWGLALGFTPNRIAQEFDLDRMAREIIWQDASLRGGIVDLILEWERESAMAGAQEDEAGVLVAEDRLGALWTEAHERGVGQKLLRNVRDRRKQLGRPRLQRRLEKGAPRRLRERLRELEELRISPVPETVGSVPLR